MGALPVGRTIQTIDEPLERCDFVSREPLFAYELQDQRSGGPVVELLEELAEAGARD